MRLNSFDPSQQPNMPDPPWVGLFWFGVACAVAIMLAA